MSDRSKARACLMLVLAAGASAIAGSTAAGQARPTTPAQSVTIRPVAYVQEEPPPPDAPPPAEVFVRISGAGEELWSGNLSIEAGRGAQLTMTLQEAETSCPGEQVRRTAGRRQTGLTFSLRQPFRRGVGEPFGLSASWTRPSRDCALPGTRTIGIETSVLLEAGAPQVVEGDGGLRIELTRR